MEYKFLDDIYIEEFTLEIPYEKIICRNCFRKKCEYYEAVLQLRPKNHPLYEEIKKEILKYENLISKKEEREEGEDFYFVSFQKLRKTIEKLNRKYKVKVKYSERIHTFDRQKGKTVYKVTISLRLI